MIQSGGGKWTIPAIKGPAPTSAAKPGGSSGAGAAANKHANTPSGGKDIASALNSKNKQH